MKTCENCVLNEKYPHINFNKKNICNYCTNYEKYKDKIEDKKLLKKLFKKRMEKIKGQNKYDCLIGISGGKDSSYVLHILKNKYNLNVLTYTFDNGFLSDYAKNNIKNLVEKTGVDHFFHKAEWDFQKKLYKKFMKTRGIPCKGCSLGAYGTSFKFAFEKNIPFVIHGRTPSQIFREFIPESTDPTIPFIKNNLQEYNKEKQIETLITVADRLMNLTSGIGKNNEELLNKLLKEFFPDVSELLTSDTIPEFLGFFLYYPYNEKNIKNVLEKELKWTRPKKDKTFSHADCLIHDAVEYIRYKKFGYTIIEPEISVLIRQNKKTKEKALKRIKAEQKDISEPKESLKILCKKLNLDYKKFKRNLEKTN